MASERARLSPEGMERLQKELARLKAKRVEVVETVRVTREDGDLKENFPYHAARQELGLLLTQIASLEDKIKHAEVVDQPSGWEQVDLGVPITVRNEATGQIMHLTIVDSSEMNFVDNAVSADSPLGEALLYLEVGDEAEARTPAGTLRLTVVSIGE